MHILKRDKKGSLFLDVVAILISKLALQVLLLLLFERALAMRVYGQYIYS